MLHKAIWKGNPMRLELTRVGLPVLLANHYTTTGTYYEEYVYRNQKHENILERPLHFTKELSYVISSKNLEPDLCNFQLLIISLVLLFSSVPTLFGSLNTELKVKQFSLA